MNCPYCKQIMKRGYISAYNRLNWTPENETNHGATKWAKSPNSVLLAEYPFIGAATVLAFYRKKKKKVIIDVSER